MEHIKYASKELLTKEAKDSLEKLQEIEDVGDIAYYGVINAYNDFAHYWGRISPKDNDFELIENRVHQLKEHWEDFWWLYNELGDYRSKKVLYGILRTWMTFEFDIKKQMKEYAFADYYDLDLITCDEDEVLVDLGAYTGDSALAYIDSYGNYKRIYCYEMTPATFEEMKENLKEHNNIVCRNVGVGKESTTLAIKVMEECCGANRIGETGDIEVQIVTLDEDIQEKITFIKMDIEGSEIEAIEGAKRHITEEHPKMAICTYHNNHHIWEVPRKVKELNPDYKLYMRYNGAFNEFKVSEYVLFAL